MRIKNGMLAFTFSPKCRASIDPLDIGRTTGEYHFLAFFRDIAALSYMIVLVSVIVAVCTSYISYILPYISYFCPPLPRSLLLFFGQCRPWKQQEMERIFLFQTIECACGVEPFVFIFFVA